MLSCTDEGIPVGSPDPDTYAAINLCEDWSPDHSLICTRANGHDGRHIGHGSSSTNHTTVVLGVWGFVHPDLDVAEGL